MNIIRNEHLTGESGKTISLDIYYNERKVPKPLIIFAHGFKGFKDWGHWGVIGEAFAEAGYCFIKFNFSHNGVTPENPHEFVDLEGFGQNNYTKELSDLQTVLDWVQQNLDLKEKTNWQNQNITLIGHSRGGPIALIAAKENEAVKQVITWASVHELDYAWQKTTCSVSAWKRDGVYYVENVRTHQQMPIYYQIYEDYIQYPDRFSVQKNLEKLDKPYLIVHGTADPAVPEKAAEYLAKYARKGERFMIQDANHVFGGSHPFEGKELPEHSRKLVKKCLDFLKNCGSV